MGTLGIALAEELMMKDDIEVIAVDVDMDHVERVKDIVTQAVRLDATHKEALEALEVDKFDVCVVAIGEDMMSSILATLQLKELGVKRIIARYSSAQHKLILEKIGVSEAISPEVEMGMQIAKRISDENVISHIELSDEHAVEEIDTGDSFAGKTLRDLDVRNRFTINVVAIKHTVTDDKGNEKEVIVHDVPDPDYRFELNDVLVAVGLEKNLAKFKKTLKTD